MMIDSRTKFRFEVKEEVEGFVSDEESKFVNGR